MADRAYNEKAHRLAVAQLKRNPQMCWKNCGRWATQIDHDPALALHPHTSAGTCCVLRPVCAHCNASHGATLGNTKREPHSEQWWA